METIKEVWKDIPGYEGRYQASTEGRIRGKERDIKIRPLGKTPYIRRQPAQICSACIGSHGYLCVGLRKDQKSANATWELVHELVARTFIGPRPEGLQICHEDGDKLNNRITNLRYDSASENHIDVYRAGGKYGKLSTEDVRNIRDAMANGENDKEIAARYGLSTQSIRNIKARRRFGWLK